ncbi:hypothetical protein [Ramlibacter sp. WS9]|uniref:hypothetical protein n=1 Tax=Ramlibacter sp. WS9 TaxID=1882741 RepID=UPI001143C61F|nr:hypothetical protein [Ramlibacter sp. WS9]ROZ72090.1 hypothetical protein EEB15_20135 [Ramlibacter sp. WS9]
MDFSIGNYHSIADSMISEWTRRSLAPMVASKGPGCFIWDAKKNGIQSTGMFYTKDMVPKYFNGEMAIGLQQMIEEADHSSEVVVALIFDDKAMGLRLAKTDSNKAKELVPPIIH